MSLRRNGAYKKRKLESFKVIDAKLGTCTDLLNDGVIPRPAVHG